MIFQIIIGIKSVSENDKKAWPWSKGSFDIKRREQREVSPNTLAAVRAGVIRTPSPEDEGRRKRRSRFGELF